MISPETVKAVLFVPGLFCERMKTDAGLRNPFIFLISCVLIHTLIVGLFARNQAIITVIIYIFVLWPIMTQILGSQWLTATP